MPRRVPRCFLMLALLASLAGCGDDDDDDSAAPVDDDTADDDADDDDPPDDDGDDDTWPPLPDDDADDDALPEGWLRAINGSDARIVDDAGRQVLLRGVNFNHLGDYFVTDPSLPTTAELGPDDWDDAAAMGTNVVRLVTTWSAWQPERGDFDGEYLERVRDAVADAAERGIYVVIDMHQDAWSKFVFTPVDETYPEGTSHQRGWDGAPEWATFTDGQPTCTPGRREESPAVIRAWDNFYANRDGVRDELAALWGRIAAEFAFEPNVAGFDLLNETGNGGDLLATSRGLTAFYRSAIDAIRAAEEEAGAPGHIVFFELSVIGTPPGLSVRAPNTVFAPHNYAESIGPSTPGLLDLLFGVYDLFRRAYRAPIWVGEYNKFSDPASNEAWTARYAALDDRYRQDGGTWWQWEQECGDPHNAQYPPTPEWIGQQQQSCGDARFTPSTCLGRAFPRAVPGRLTHLSATPCAGGDLVVAGTTEEPGAADLWFPGSSSAEPAVTGAGVTGHVATAVPGGWRIAVDVAGDYDFTVTPAE